VKLCFVDFDDNGFAKKGMLKTHNDTIRFVNLCFKEQLIESLTVVLGPRAAEVCRTAKGIYISRESSQGEKISTYRESA
jgi:hypothetical protein